MKHLKGFNESKEDQFYHKIDREIFNEGRSVFHFDYSEKSKLKDFCDKNDIIIHGDVPLHLIMPKKHLILSKHVVIYKEDDEWFIVASDTMTTNTKYYKADQIEGLIKLIQDILDDWAP